MNQTNQNNIMINKQLHQAVARGDIHPETHLLYEDPPPAAPVVNTLHSTLYTLHPAPCTPHPTPHPLYPPP